VDDAYAQPLSIEQVHPARAVEPSSLKRLIRHVIDAEGGTLVHLSVVLADHDRVRSLNAQYLGHDYNTDVLAFSLREDDPDAVEGEIYVDLDTAAERHEEFDASFEREVQRYVVHGVLHLLGYDDTTSAGNDTMRSLEDRYLDAAAPSA